MKILSYSDIGVRRKDNQDNFWCARLEVNGDECGVLCVCDGMGGLNDGGLASGMVIKAVREAILSSSDLEVLKSVLPRVNTEVFNKGAESGKRMGTTCTLLRCSKGKYEILHIGDSRCYRFHDGEVSVLTKDHSAIAKYGISKEENPELYRKHKNQLTRCIGVKPDIDVDYITGDYSSGDKFLVCSDGFWHYFDSDTGILDKGSLKDAVDACISNGETDNITIGVLEV